jgi:hypothetical protein
VLPFARYTLLRILLFAAVLTVLVLFSVRGLTLLVGALLISAALSYLLLSGPRAALVERLEARAEARAQGPRRRDAAARDAEAEDAAVDRASGRDRRPPS